MTNPEDHADHLEDNRRHWDEAATLHPDTDQYDVDGFLAGESSLQPIELAEVGDRVGPGTDLLHLQCHFGMDTLSWARKGATVVGLDFSGEAVERARDLRERAGIDRERARFVEANVYDAPEAVEEAVGHHRFDVVFTSYGVLSWLPDVDRWAEVVAACLRPGGTFYVVELHPLTNTFEFEYDGGETGFPYPYFGHDEPLTVAGSDTYATEDADMDHGTTHFWAHGVGEVVTALLDAGLELEFVREHDRLPTPLYEDMAADDEGLYRFESGVDLPLLLSVRARKPG